MPKMQTSSSRNNTTIDRSNYNIQMATMTKILISQTFFIKQKAFKIIKTLSALAKYEEKTFIHALSFSCKQMSLLKHRKHSSQNTDFIIASFIYIPQRRRCTESNQSQGKCQTSKQLF